MKSHYPIILAGSLAVVGNTTFSAGMDSPHAESSPAYQEAQAAYAERIQQLPRAGHRNRLEEWSRGLGFDLPLEQFEQRKQIRQAAHRNEHDNKMQEWSRGLGFTLPDIGGTSQ